VNRRLGQAKTIHPKACWTVARAASLSKGDFANVSRGPDY
jgi:hypothetical protein